jgi:trk system potassium uptake protein TrkA
MRILVVGAGDIGFHLCRRLAFEQHDLTLIDQDAKKVQRAREQLDAIVIEGSGSSLARLRQAGVEHMHLMAALTDNDEVNLIACRIAKKAGVPITIARVRNREFTQPDFLLSSEELGTDFIIHPESETAKAVVQLIHQASATYAFEFESGKIQVLGVRLEQSSPLVHTPLVRLNSYCSEHMRIVAIERNHETLIPDGETVLQPGDQIFAVCDHHYLSDFWELAGKEKRSVSNIMILGGGLVGRAIAQELEAEAHIKIIEANEETARCAAEELPNALVIHGDGTDLDLLKEEGLEDMDAFVAVTGDDEKNIISTLLARQVQVPRAIALVNRVEHMPIIPTIGLDTVVSKQLLTVNAVQHLIQSQIADIATPPGMDAQLIEFIAGARSKITRRPLRDVGFPPNAIVGAIMRDDEVIIPHGGTCIEPGDKTVVFTLPQAVQRVEKLFGR